MSDWGIDPPEGAAGWPLDQIIDSPLRDASAPCCEAVLDDGDRPRCDGALGHEMPHYHWWDMHSFATWGYEDMP